MKSLVVPTLFLFTICGLETAHGADLATGPGIAKEKPAEGRSVEIKGGFMVAYEVKFPESKESFWMDPIPGGEFVMGSPEAEKGRESIEGPQRVITVDPFWMARCDKSSSGYRIIAGLGLLHVRHE